MLPSAFILYNTVSQSVQTSKLLGFVSETVVYPGTEVVKQEVDFLEGQPVVHVVLLGATVPEDVVRQWAEELDDEMEDATLEVVQNDGPSGLEDLQRMVNLYAEGQTALSLRDAELVRLRSELAALKDQDLPNSLAAEILAQAPDIASVEVAHRKRLNQAG